MAVTIDPTKTGTSDEVNPTFASLTVSGPVTLSGGTANGVAYLNGSKVLTTGSALTFDGTNLATTGNVSASVVTASSRVVTDDINARTATRVSINNVSGTSIATFDHSTGLSSFNFGAAVTGSISASAIAETFISTASTTSPRSMHLANMGGDVYFGIEGSSSGGFFTGSAAYATVVYSTQRVQTIISGTKITDVDSSGITITGYIAGTEQTAPAAPAANGYRIFAQDNGAGKTQLMVIFASGAAQQIAIEP